MHRIASLGDVQESNKHERHVQHGANAHGDNGSVLWDSDDEQHAALVDLGKVFEYVLKNTLVALVAAAGNQSRGCTTWHKTETTTRCGNQRLRCSTERTKKGPNDKQVRVFFAI